MAPNISYWIPLHKVSTISQKHRTYMFWLPLSKGVQSVLSLQGRQHSSWWLERVEILVHMVTDQEIESSSQNQKQIYLSKAHQNLLPLVRLHVPKVLQPPKHEHQLETRDSNTGAWEGHFTVKPHRNPLIHKPLGGFLGFKSQLHRANDSISTNLK